MKIIISLASTVLLSFTGLGFYHAHAQRLLNITKSVTIDASMQEVFNKVKYLNQFPEWSPFLEEDPQQQYEVKGIDGKRGAQYHWNGRNGKDIGYQEIKEIKENEFIRMQCDIQKPFEAAPIFDYTFEKTDQGIKVTQDFRLESSKADAFFMWIFGAKKSMDKTNARGMELLKLAIEKGNS